MQSGEKRFYSAARVRGHVGLRRVDAGGIAPLVPNPRVDNLFGLDQLSRFSRAEFALVHFVLPALSLVLCMSLMPSVALATSDMGDGFSGTGGGSYDDWLDDLLSNPDAVWNRTSDWLMSWGGGGGGHAFSGNNGSGGSATPSLDANYYYFWGYPHYSKWDDVSYYLLGEDTSRYVTHIPAPSGYSLMNNEITLRIPKAALASLNAKCPYEDNQWYVYLQWYNGAIYTLHIYGSGLDYGGKSTNTIDEVVYEYYSKPTKNGSDIWYTNLSSAEYVFDGSVITINTNAGSVSKWPASNGLSDNNVGTMYLTSAGADVTGDDWGGDETTDTPSSTTYPSDNPDYPTPTNHTEPTTTYPTTGNQTDSTIDLSPITQRQDETNAYLYGIGGDLGNLYNLIWGEFDQLEAEIYDLGDFLGAYLQAILGGIGSINSKMSTLIAEVQTLDHDTDDIDLSGVNSRLDDVIDALGAQGAYDDTALISAITGSGGSDLLGLFGRIDIILNWLDGYTGFDDSGLVTLIENIYDSLYNLQDEDTAFNTIRGDVMAISNDVDSSLALLQHQLGDMTDTDSDVLTVRGLLYWIHHYISDIDRVLHDWPEYPDSLDLSTLEQYASDSLDELRDFAINFISFCSDFDARLDELLLAIQNLDFGNRYNPVSTPERPTPAQIVQYVDWVEWDNAVETLMHKFPFVIINDIALLFSALTRPAVTPVFDLPMPNPSDWSSPYMVHVDLSDFDTMAAVMRVGIMLWVISRVSRRTLALFTRDEGAAA